MLSTRGVTREEVAEYAIKEIHIALCIYHIYVHIYIPVQWNTTISVFQPTPVACRPAHQQILFHCNPCRHHTELFERIFSTFPNFSPTDPHTPQTPGAGT